MAVMDHASLLASWPKHLFENDLEDNAADILQDGGTISSRDGAKDFAPDFKSFQLDQQSVDMLEGADFEAWMDEKIDLDKIGLSLMDFEVNGTLLDDFLMMDGGCPELGSSLMDNGLTKPDSIVLPPLDVKVERLTTNNNDMYGSVTCTPPDSPSALVPASPKNLCVSEPDQLSFTPDSTLQHLSPLGSDVVDAVNDANLSGSPFPLSDYGVGQEINIFSFIPSEMMVPSEPTSVQGPELSLSPVGSDESVSDDVNTPVSAEKRKTDSESDASIGPIVTKRSRLKQAHGKSGRRGVVSDVTRRERKKSQNKDAATRYRYKKRAELQSLLDEEAALQGKNTELQDKVQKLSNEISYLKNLMREVYKAKGLLK